MPVLIAIDVIFAPETKCVRAFETGLNARSGCFYGSVKATAGSSRTHNPAVSASRISEIRGLRRVGRRGPRAAAGPWTRGAASGPTLKPYVRITYRIVNSVCDVRGRGSKDTRGRGIVVPGTFRWRW
eukprot:3367798-Prymnesium_polylepis.1